MPTRKPEARSKKPAKAGAKAKAPAVPASGLIDQHLRELSDWRGETLARMRALILEADSEVIE